MRFAKIYLSDEYCYYLNGTALSDYDRICLFSSISLVEGSSYVLTVECVGGSISNSSAQSPFFCLGTLSDYWMSRELSSSVKYGSFVSSYSRLSTSRLFIPSACTFSSYKFRITLNAGTRRYPFIPSLNEVYSAGYDAGVAKSSLGPLGDAFLSGEIYYQDEDGYKLPLTESLSGFKPTYTKNGLMFTDLAEYWDYNGTYDIYGAKLLLHLRTPIRFENYSFYCFGSSLITECTFITDKNKRYSGKVDVFTSENLETSSINYYRISVPSFADSPFETFYIDFIEFDIPSLDILYEFGLYSVEAFSLGDYNDGYNVGFSDGKEVGDSSGYERGWDTGYGSGYNQGVSDAYNRQAENGTISESITSFIYALFDAPVDTFMSIFNFEVAGFNIGALVSFILTMLICVFIYRLFA